MIRKHPSNRRSGVVLLVVITLLALFAAMGLSFVFYAEGEAQSAAINSQAESKNKPDIDPDLLWSYCLQRLIYGEGSFYVANSTNPYGPSSPNGLYSAMRGNDLGTNMYGYNFSGPNPNTYAFNGMDKKLFAAPTLFTGQPAGLTYADLVNCTYCPADPFIIDPERMNLRLGAYPTVMSQPLSGPYVGWNGPYTYPDMNNFFLGTMDTSGELLAGSFFRNYASTLLPMDPQHPNYPNWSSTAPWWKYLTVRPHPSMHPYFLPPGPGGDVKNMEFGPGLKNPFNGTYYANDSIWMDLGFGVMIGPDGRKYKPMFAMLVVDLDGKINVNACGNIAGPGKINASASGLGPWEISLSQFFTGPDYQNVFLGANSLPGRYGSSAVPGIARAKATGLITSKAPPNQGPLALKAVTTAGAQVTTKGLLPGDPNNTNASYFSFPNWTVGGWPTYGLWNSGTNSLGQSAGSAGDITNHPSADNVFYPAAGGSTNVAFRDSDLEAIYRYRGTGSPSLGTGLFRIAPNSMNDPTGHNRMSLTTRSYSLGTPAAAPWLTKTSAPLFTLANGSAASPGGTLAYPTGVPTAYPAATGVSPATGEFDPSGSWNYATQLLQKVNLNRTLTDYPAPSKTTGIITNVTQYNQAVSDRQTLAKDIFNVFVQVTMAGVQPPATAPLPGDLTYPNYQAYLWLAQLAVNIVDFRDTDNYITPFNWNLTDTTSGWVYGTEQPRLVINEAYAQVENNPKDPLPGGKAKDAFNLNMWVELLNPLSNDPSVVDVLSGVYGAVRLEMPGTTTYPIYTLTASQLPAGGGSPFSTANFGQQLGTPIPLGGSTVNAYSKTAKNALQTVLPSGTTYTGTAASNQGFYVIGPESTGGKKATDSNLHPTLQTKLMTTNIPVTNLNPAGTPNNKLNFFLQRLLCPDLPPQPIWPIPLLSTYYNPYVTVDYVQNVIVYDGVTNDMLGAHVPVPFANRYSQGRMQPFAAAAMVNQQPAPAVAGLPQTTFFRHNSLGATAPTAPLNPNETLTVPFNWLVHPDRQVTSPLEILHTSAYPPYQLTQLFMNAQAPFQPYYGHASMPAWFDSTARLYRALEFFDAGNRAAATDVYGQNIPLAGRIPGKVNINSIWDKKQLRALADPQTGLSLFSQADVDNIFTNMVSNSVYCRSPAGMPAAGDRPFKGFATANLPSSGGVNFGVEDTLLRPLNPTAFANSDPASRLFGLNPATPTYWNLSVSNNPAYGNASPFTPPPYMKMDLLNKLFNNVTCQSNVFAVWLTVGFFDVTDGPVTQLTSQAISGMSQIQVASVQNTQLGVPWIIQPGICMWVDSEPVRVTGVTGSGPYNVTLANKLQNNHAANAAVSMKGVLGGEVGLSEGRNVRHRMFAIVDRSALSIPAVLSTTTSIIAAPLLPGTKSLTPAVTLSLIQGTSQLAYPNSAGTPFLSVNSVNGQSKTTALAPVSNVGPSLTVNYAWQIKQNMMLAIYDPNTGNQEIFQVKSIGPGNIITPVNGFSNGYGAGSYLLLPGRPGAVPNSILGNPGPQQMFDPRQNTALVPHFTVIQ